MLPTTYQSLAILLLAIVPGYIATVFWARARTWKGRGTDLLTVLQSLAISVLIQIPMTPLAIAWLYPIRDSLDQHPWIILCWLLLTILVLPILGGNLFGFLNNKLANSKGSFRQHPIGKCLATLLPRPDPPTIWDWSFIHKVAEGCFVIIEFEDNKWIAGAFGKDGMVLTSPDVLGVYLPEEWNVDEKGIVGEKILNTKGVMILNTSKIRRVRLVEPKEEASNEQGKRDQGKYPGDQATTDSSTT